jgi:GT2 family glycosyltransferase
MLVSLSIVIKTFERPDSLNNLLNSIQNLGINYPIIIADDSERSSEQYIMSRFPNLQITYLNLPFDTGLSEGRNILIKNVSTSHFVLCDDDYRFTKKTDLLGAYHCAIDENIDIVGGAYLNYVHIRSLGVFLRQLSHPRRLTYFFFNRYRISRYIGTFSINNNTCELSISNKEPVESPYLCDLVNNFFVAKTSSVLNIGGWDNVLKMGEHEDFFLRAKKMGLKVAYLPGFATAHYPAIPFDKSVYNQYRVRAAYYKKLFVEKHKFTHYVEIQKETNKIHYEVKTKDPSINQNF